MNMANIIPEDRKTAEPEYIFTEVGGISNDRGRRKKALPRTVGILAAKLLYKKT